jgi:hypothetical protein
MTFDAGPLIHMTFTFRVDQIYFSLNSEIICREFDQCHFYVVCIWDDHSTLRSMHFVVHEPLNLLPENFLLGDFLGCLII